MGNIYVTGVFDDSLDFDPGSATAILNPLSPNGDMSSQNVFIAKYDADGHYKWAKQITSNYIGITFQCNLIAIDGQGNIIISGEFNDSADFDPSSNTAILAGTGGGKNIFIAKYDPSGAYLWAKAIGGTEDQWPLGIAADDIGNVYISGSFNGTVDFDPGVGNALITSAGSQDNFVAKYSSDGNYVWAHRMGDSASSSAENGLGVTVDKARNVISTGAFQGDATFSSTSNILTSGGGRDVYIMKHDSAGNFMWAIPIGSGGDDYGYNVTTDNEGNVYAAGYFQGQVDFDPGPGSATLTANAFFDAYLAKYDSEGNYQWAINVGAGFLNFFFDVETDDLGSVYVCGFFSGAPDFDPGQDTVILTSASASGMNGVLAKYNALDGAYIWAGVLESTQSSTAGSLAVDPFGNTVYVTGFFQDNVDLDPGTGQDPHTTTTTDGDVFLVKLICNSPDSVYLNEVICDSSYTLNGAVYTSSGTYIQHLVNASHCDSMIVLDLTIDPLDPPVITVDEFVLGTTQSYTSYQWIKNGVPLPGETNDTLVVHANADYQVLVTNEDGCAALSEVYTVTNVGIPDIGIASQIRIYPNPVRDRLYINSPVAVGASLYDMEGRVLLELESAQVLSLEGLAKGLYILKLSDQEGHTLKYEKVVVEGR